MAKPPTNPDLFDRHAVRLRVRDLGRLDVLKQRGGRALIEIKAEIGGESVRQTVDLETRPMPFGGFRVYFVCPVKGRRCLTLYRFQNRLGGDFACREAFPNACYSIQTLSKLDRIFARRHRAEDAISKPGLKTSYRGRPTRRFASASRRLEQAQQSELFALKAVMLRFR